MAAYMCRYCRQASEGASTTCPHCGASVDVRARVSDSGWQEQPPIPDMARIQFGQSTCQIECKYVPVADMRLAAEDWVFFSHHVLLWTEPSVRMDTMPLAGGWNRMYAGMPLVMMRAAGPGHIAFSHDDAGETVAVPLAPGQAVDVREHRFLVATGAVGYQWFDPGLWYVTGTGDDKETHYPLGRFVDRFGASSAPGLLLLNAPGNVFVRDLREGETICVQPSALLYKDPSVGMSLHFEYPGGPTAWSTYSNRAMWLRMWGPGRVAVHSVFERAEGVGYISSHSPATEQRWA